MKKLVLIVMICSVGQLLAQEPFKRTMKLMGSRFDITVVAKDPIEGEQYIDLAINEIKRIEKLISSWDPNSQTSEINKNAG
ncbi:MAG: FAD:protein FMN transferase, partial [Maribacter dokdonensis]|uniref:FAD:protein FMN transferase n=1 Tax=Maribacter dokdonensis TaxID=320912 RepID=UPI0032A084BC